MTKPTKAPPTIISFGCRLNTAEGERMLAHASASGLDNVVIINTCAVTLEAMAQARQAIRRAKRENPAARILVTGCGAQVAPEAFARLDEVDWVVGNQEKLKPETYATLAAGRTAGRVDVSDIMAAQAIGPLGTASERIRHLRVRAHIPVQTGCDHRCTFCIIPFARGPSRSVPADIVIADIRRLVEDGTKEVVLTGVDMTSYGADLPDMSSLGHLVLRILRDVPELPRLRLSSVDTIELDAALFEAFADYDRLMPHLHLSLQHGADLILKRMKRRHLRQQAIDQCQALRRVRPDMVFGADIIAGFPTETDAHVQQSLDLVDDCQLTWLHVFPYSVRPGTPAAKMPQVDGRVIKERARLLRAKGDMARQRHLAQLDGGTAKILVEHGGRGRTPSFAEVAIDAPPGRLVTARLAHVTDQSDKTQTSGRLVGRIAEVETIG